MKKLFTLFCFFTLFLNIKSQNYYQYFEGTQTSTSLAVVVSTSTNNIWQIGKPSKILFSSASTTPNVIVTDTINYYPKSNISTFTVIAKQPFMFGFAKLQWKQKLDMDVKKDGGIVEFSTNSGATWQNAHNNPNVYQYYGYQPFSKDTINTNEYCFSGTDNVWRDIWLCLNSTTSNLNDTILYRFTFKSDTVNTNKEGWVIDNFISSRTILHPVKEISNIGDILVYPNVTNGIINVEIKKTSPTDMIDNIELINEDGKVIERYGQNYTKVVLDISKHKEGLYYLRVTINKKIHKFKILYEKN